MQSPEQRIFPIDLDFVVIIIKVLKSLEAPNAGIIMNYPKLIIF